MEHFELNRLDFQPYYEDKSGCVSIIVPDPKEPHQHRPALGYIKYDKKAGRVTLANSCAQIQPSGIVQGITMISKIPKKEPTMLPGMLGSPTPKFVNKDGGRRADRAVQECGVMRPRIDVRRGDTESCERMYSYAQTDGAHDDTPSTKQHERCRFLFRFKTQYTEHPPQVVAPAIFAQRFRRRGSTGRCGLLRSYHWEFPEYVTSDGLLDCAYLLPQQNANGTACQAHASVDATESRSGAVSTGDVGV